jgi:hypothetical protein
MSIGSAIVACALIAAVIALVLTGYGHVLLIVCGAVGAVFLFAIVLTVLS